MNSFIPIRRQLKHLCLAHINMSFNTGVYPDLLKIVKVIPIHKGGSTQEVNNFRPISLLSIFDKIMEKIMHKKLYYFLEENNILFKKQFGFRKNNPTVYYGKDKKNQLIVDFRVWYLY